MVSRQTVCGNLKDLMTIVVGFFSFGGMAMEPYNLTGIGLGLIGSVVYAYIKLRSGGG